MWTRFFVVVETLFDYSVRKNAMNETPVDIRIAALMRVRFAIEMVETRLDNDVGQSSIVNSRMDLSEAVGLVSMVLVELIEAEARVTEDAPF